MSRLVGLGLVLLALSGCASPAGSTKSGAEPAPQAMDRMCVDDCLGAGGKRGFCEDRCSY